MSNFEELETLIAQAKQENEKFYNRGNSAAGTRLRGLMQDIKSKAQEIRINVVETKHSAK
jgi:hypothetical protein